MHFFLLFILQIFALNEDLGTKAPYPLPCQSFKIPSDHELIQVHFIARHGTRNPSQSEIKAFERLENLIEKYKTAFMKHFPRLLNWTNTYDLNDYHLLVQQGSLDHYELGKRFLDRTGIQDNYHPLRFDFSSSDASRSSQSGSAFAIGFFEGRGSLGAGKQQPISMSTLPKNADPLISPHESCPKFVKNNLENPFGKSEQSKYLKMILPPIMNRLNAVLGTNVFNQKDVYSIYKACAFEVSIFNQTQTWCSLFTPLELHQLSFSQDLVEYWQLGYGTELAGQVSCQLLTQIFSQFQTIVESGKADTKAFFKFGHKPTVTLMTTLLGLFKTTDHLYANSTQEQIKKRKFRTSLISPFASNIQFELLRKKNYLLFQSLKDGGNYFIRVLLNEVPVKVPGCQDYFCEYEQFRKLIESHLYCDFDALCSLN